MTGIETLGGAIGKAMLSQAAQTFGKRVFGDKQLTSLTRVIDTALRQAVEQHLQQLGLDDAVDQLDAVVDSLAYGLSTIEKPQRCADMAFASVDVSEQVQRLHAMLLQNSAFDPSTLSVLHDEELRILDCFSIISYYVEWLPLLIEGEASKHDSPLFEFSTTRMLGDLRDSVLRVEDLVARMEGAPTTASDTDGPADIATVIASYMAPHPTTAAINRLGSAASLERALAESCLVYLGALSGAGKTTVVAQFVERVSRERGSQCCVWMLLRTGQSLQEMLDELPPELSGTKGDSPGYRCRLLLEALGRFRILLVCDDFHRADEASFDPLIRLGHMNGFEAKIIFIGQGDVPYREMQRVALPGLVTTEVVEMLERLGGIDYDQGIVAELGQRTGGLPIAIRMFHILVCDYGYPPLDLLRGQLQAAALAQQWLGQISSRLEVDERDLLHALAVWGGPFPYHVVRLHMGARAASAQVIGAVFDRLVSLFLVESFRGNQWVVHQFIAGLLEATTAPDDRRSQHLALAEMTSTPFRGHNQWGLGPRAVSSLLRSARFLVAAESPHEAETRVLELAAAAKRLGYFQPLADICKGLKDKSGASPWIRYHYAHCRAVLGHPREAVDELALLDTQREEPALMLAAARVKAAALSELGQANLGVHALRRELAQVTPESQQLKKGRRQAEAALVGVLVDAGLAHEARSLAGRLLNELPRRDHLGRAIVMANLGRLEDDEIERRGLLEGALEGFRAVDYRRGIAWVQRLLLDTDLVAGIMDHQAKGAVMEVTVLSARVGEASSSYLAFLRRVYPLLQGSERESVLVSDEAARVSQILGAAASVHDTGDDDGSPSSRR